MSEYYPINEYTLKGVELHLDHLAWAIETGHVKATADELAVIRSLSERVGGFSSATDSPAHAMRYEQMTRRMMDALGEFYDQFDTPLFKEKAK